MRTSIKIGLAVTIIATVAFATSGAVVITDPTHPLVMLFGVWHVAAFGGAFVGYLAGITYELIQYDLT